ncbi:DUF4870 domain-containing protein [Haloflavibacter putidus]|uniref:DUF4870 domain-containing protein n=1 Tax=Haloflavibacter putidus TaxID=2576776 RepID=A0A507ZHK7_9FLAO|nr:hypothetical protein [Haloflavibacter putidus]TQD36960.1 hypothetical protein FKR84_10140 [Haloflavibacter putidus]
MQTQAEHKIEIADKEKNIGIIAYLTLIGLIVAFVMNNEEKSSYAQYHIKQSLGLMLSGLALGVIGLIPILGWIVSILGTFFLLYLWIMGLLNAINSKQKPVPILGTHYEKWFQNL